MTPLRTLHRALIRWRYRLANIYDHGEELNRRVAVECKLLAAAAGKRPLPDRDECKRLAYELGIPTWARIDPDD